MNETASEIEIAVAGYFGIRRNLIVPNVSWGLSRLHECDLLLTLPIAKAIGKKKLEKYANAYIILAWMKSNYCGSTKTNMA